MLVKPPLEKLLPKVDNRYVLAILVAKRARQLVNGAQPLVHSDSPNLVTVACEELGSNRVACVHGHVSPFIPLRPEIEAARLAAQAAAEQASTADAIKEELDKVGSQNIVDDGRLGLDDATLIGEQLMNLQPTEAFSEGAEAESESVETVESDSADTETEDAAMSAESANTVREGSAEKTAYASREVLNTDQPFDSEDFPIKLAPPMEAAHLLGEKLTVEAEDEE